MLFSDKKYLQDKEQETFTQLGENFNSLFFLMLCGKIPNVLEKSPRYVFSTYKWYTTPRLKEQVNFTYTLLILEK